MGAIADPHALIFDPHPQAPQVSSLVEKWKFRRNVFCLFFVRTHTKFCKEIFEIDFVIEI